MRMASTATIGSGRSMPRAVSSRRSSVVIERPYDSPRCTGPSIVERLSCTPSRSESRSSRSTMDPLEETPQVAEVVWFPNRWLRLH